MALNCPTCGMELSETLFKKDDWLYCSCMMRFSPGSGWQVDRFPENPLAKLAAFQSIIDKLPRTADGVVWDCEFMPWARVSGSFEPWFSRPDMIEVARSVEMRSEDGKLQAVFPRGNIVPFCQCFSTYEAVIASEVDNGE